LIGSGKIGFPEFMSMMARRMKQVSIFELESIRTHMVLKADTQDELIEAFRVFDAYNEGIIPEKELTDALLNTGDKLTREEVSILAMRHTSAVL
jgi:Ca2+-binding EF-hand superfamily protein